MGFVVDNTMVIAIIAATLSGWLCAFIVYDMIAKHIPDWRVMVYSAKKNIPCLAVLQTGSRKVKLYPGKKKKADDVVFEIPGHPGVLDPADFADAVPEIWGKNTQIHHYALDQPLPISDRNARAIMTIIHTVRNQIPRLNFLSDEQVIELLETPRNNLFHDCDVVLRAMKEEDDFENDVDIDELVKLIIIAQELASNTPVELGFFSYIYAFKRIPFAYTPQYLKHFEMLTERKTQKKLLDQHTILMILIMGGVITIVAGAVAYNMVT